jgi:Kef-type K+ transport system membrane component KefB
MRSRLDHQYYPLNLPFSPILSLPRGRSLPFLTLIANVGLILYMFLVGLELEPLALLRNARQTVAISVTGIIVPFCLGALGR